ncbi:hypothetical protein B5P45_17485 [Phyllobacterium zundukense]|uniref:HTH cro/C1-type domain-containing protein n=2 Tax=Phyllobacterium zundukense TaxID=1867719 RepID=A0A2N9VW22_9HYPH|nr:hypothetical protein BLM14_07100 [Phyllobacterium zundukense]PIO43690.1 hypothetical protein B5P45_17485 [Phyllobacterium zundukense]
MCKKHECGVRFDLTIKCALCTLKFMNQHIDIKALRERLNWKQDRLARFLGVDRSSVSHMENGRPPRGPVRKLLETLVSAADRGDVDALSSDLENAA